MPRIIFKLILPWVLSLTLVVLHSHAAVSFPHAGSIPCHIIPPIDLQAYPLNLHLHQTRSYSLLKPCVNSNTALSPRSTLPSSLSACIHNHRSTQQTHCLLHSNNHPQLHCCSSLPARSFIAALPIAPHIAKASTDPRSHHQRAAYPRRLPLPSRSSYPSSFQPAKSTQLPIRSLSALNISKLCSRNLPYLVRRRTLQACTQ